MTDIRLNASAVVWRQVDGEILALDMGASRYLGTNPTGALLWQALAEGTSRDRLVELLRSRFEIDEHRAGADVDAFLGELQAHGLLAA
jgi:hypothetical protein